MLSWPHYNVAFCLAMSLSSMEKQQKSLTDIIHKCGQAGTR